MQNWLWFLLLTILSLSLFFYNYHKIKSPHVLLFWLFISGLSYLLELIIFVVFDSYSYHPHVFADSFNDSVLGAITSQAFSVPIALTFISSSDYRLRWKAGLVVVFFLIEQFFLYLGVYQHFWWRTWYTAIILTIAIPLGRKWYISLEQARSPRLYFITLFFVIYTILASLVWGLSSILNLLTMHPGWFDETSRDNVFGFSIYLWIAAAFYTCVIFYQYGNIMLMVGTALFLFLMERTMTSTGLLIFHPQWLIYLTPFVHVINMRLMGGIYKKYFPSFAFWHFKNSSV
ncbi:hypothetical protein [Falsibacillus pallidus]|uniref:hypothetical protein n=1 Tax=Falsibacillus pallidus TaxID=493781 RepID=UPI003D97C5F6